MIQCAAVNIYLRHKHSMTVNLRPGEIWIIIIKIYFNECKNIKYSGRSREMPRHCGTYALRVRRVFVARYRRTHSIHSHIMTSMIYFDKSIIFSSRAKFFFAFLAFAVRARSTKWICVDFMKTNERSFLFIFLPSKCGGYQALFKVKDILRQTETLPLCVCFFFLFSFLFVAEKEWVAKS